MHGYELVQPPLMEYSHSLLTHIDAGLSLKTILVVDQLSGRQLSIRRVFDFFLVNECFKSVNFFK